METAARKFKLKSFQLWNESLSGNKQLVMKAEASSFVNVDDSGGTDE